MTVVRAVRERPATPGRPGGLSVRRIEVEHLALSREFLVAVVDDLGNEMHIRTVISEEALELDSRPDVIAKLGRSLAGKTGMSFWTATTMLVHALNEHLFCKITHSEMNQVFLSKVIASPPPAPPRALSWWRKLFGRRAGIPKARVV